MTNPRKEKFLMLTMAVSLVALPAANAKKATYAFVGAIPNPVGYGQTVLLHVGITDALRIATDGWQNLTVTVTSHGISYEAQNRYFKEFEDCGLIEITEGKIKLKELYYIEFKAITE